MKIKCYAYAYAQKTRRSVKIQFIECTVGTSAGFQVEDYAYYSNSSESHHLEGIRVDRDAVVHDDTMVDYGMRVKM